MVNLDGTPPLLDVRSAAMAYRSPSNGLIEVFRDLSLTVAAGELVAVVGRSGSGKTTLLQIVSGLLNPMAGEVRWSGELVSGLDGARLVETRARQLGIVFQGAALIDSLTAAENVVVPALPRGVTTASRARALELLDRVALSDRADHFPRQLSGGEQQRTAVARAMFADPPLLVVDEPTANLDRRSGDELISLLVGLARDGRGLLVASHDPDLIAAADRLIEIERMTISTASSVVRTTSW